ncbi:MAG: transcription-repair coupling factor [Bacteroidales bacterium]|nr:transcription-repair coupling factor [Bacteroidales bacterium]
MLISTKTSGILSERLKTDKEIYCSGLFLSARWFVLTQSAGKGVHLVVMPTQEAAEYCTSDLYNLTEGDIVFYIPSSGKNIERSTYKSSLGVQRTSAIARILEAKDEQLYLVSYPEALEERIPSVKEISSAVMHIATGSVIPYDSISEKLTDLGFDRVDFVSSPGQFAVRGALIDVFSYSNNNPYRISFFGDEVESIHIFDANTQLSSESVQQADIIADMLCEEGERSIFDILPEDTRLWLDSSDMYKDKGIWSEMQRFPRVFMDIPLSKDASNVLNFKISPQPIFNKNFDLLTSDIRTKIETGYKVFIYGEKKSQLDRLSSILEHDSCPSPQFIQGANIHNGFIDAEDKICCYSDHEIFDRFHRVSIRRTVDKTEQLTINDLNSIQRGDYIVHIDHGVGIFGGLVRLKDDYGRLREVVKLLYKDGDVVYISVHSLNKISRFRAKEGEVPQIHRLGSKTWTALKNGAKSKVKDIAKELIQLYAKRKATPGYAFSADSYLQKELESSFMYEDTPDQELATAMVKQDMESNCPMDRLICGDVGFGKTEIAVRAAFKAVCDSKQVVVLVPTTVLAIQHYNTFSARLKDFPCSVECLSRLKTAKETSEIKQKLANGQIDILVSTHKILGKGFNFKDLGLLIIDEEQKFGVSAKEKLRQLKTSIDTLTLTATPIPRTMQFYLLGARDLSIINTPPPNRIPIQTEIILFDEKEIKGILDYELNRGGQIFFLHNNVEQLPSIAEILQRLEPDMKICIIHGQMESKVLENRMLEFIRGDYDCLLCTTIIENGLDIPNANTIIINHAQNIGLSDLHQLRGRVGRSNRKAFCYLIIPPLVSITEEARRRLRAIEEFSDLGSGFNIAMQDLDIRGAGNLLGAEQSGFITDMGFETYQKIISEAMEELGIETGIDTSTPSSRAWADDCTIETDQPAHIPDDYIEITSEKMRIYKQMDSIVSEKELDRLRGNIEDRFGKIPAELDNLFDVVKIRNLGMALGFEKIIFKNGMLICFFISDPKANYYKSGRFTSVLQKISESEINFALKQSDDKLKIITKGVQSLSQALSYLRKLQ